MQTVKSPIRIALLVAIPIESVNFWFNQYPIDVGLPAGARWYTKALDTSWLLLHLPGLWFVVRVDSWLGVTRFGRLLEISLVAASGYVDTAVALVIGCMLFRLLRRLGRGADTVREAQ